MKLTICKYHVSGMFHDCKDESGQSHRVDIMVDGTLTQFNDDPTKLEGKVVEVEWLSPYIEVAGGVTLVN